MDSEPIELLADERPVDVEVESEVIELLADDKPVDADVDRLVMFDVVVLATAELAAADRVGAGRADEASATFWIRRSALT